MQLESSLQDKSIYSDKYQMTLQSLWNFEIRSLYGRTFYSKNPTLKKDGENLLHLGCGGNKLENWTNADFFKDLKFWKKSKNRPDWMLDLRFPLNCNDHVWDGVFSEHTLEHLYPNQVLNLLKELNRTIKPGAWIRISVPDLSKYISFYCQEKVDKTFDKWSMGSEAIRSLTQNYGHLSVWDSQLLCRFLQKSGFVNAKEVSFMEGTDKLLLQDSISRQWESLYVEAQKQLEI